MPVILRTRTWLSYNFESIKNQDEPHQASEVESRPGDEVNIWVNDAAWPADRLPLYVGRQAIPAMSIFPTQVISCKSLDRLKRGQSERPSSTGPSLWPFLPAALATSFERCSQWRMWAATVCSVWHFEEYHVKAIF